MNKNFFEIGIIFSLPVFQWNSRYAFHEMTFQ